MVTPHNHARLRLHHPRASKPLGLALKQSQAEEALRSTNPNDPMFGQLQDFLNKIKARADNLTNERRRHREELHDQNRATANAMADDFLRALLDIDNKPSDDRGEQRAFALFRELLLIKQQHGALGPLWESDLAATAEIAVRAVRAFKTAWSSPAEP